MKTSSTSVRSNNYFMMAWLVAIIMIGISISMLFSTFQKRNMKTVEPTPVSTPAPVYIEYEYHTLEYGDTLSEIVYEYIEHGDNYEYYGTRSNFTSKIMSVNDIKSANLIMVGETLKIPVVWYEKN